MKLLVCQRCGLRLHKTRHRRLHRSTRQKIRHIVRIVHVLESNLDNSLRHDRVVAPWRPCNPTRDVDVLRSRAVPMKVLHLRYQVCQGFLLRCRVSGEKT